MDAEPSIPYFHTSEANAGEGAFEGVSEEFRRMKVRDLAAIIGKHEPVGLISWVAFEDWKEIILPRVRPGFEDPYFPLFDWIVKELFNYQATSGIREFAVDYVFDDRTETEMKANLVRIHEGIRKEASSVPELHRMLGARPVFKDDKTILPLQAADLLVWHKRRQLNFPNEKREMNERLDRTVHLEKHLDRDYLLSSA